MEEMQAQIIKLIKQDRGVMCKDEDWHKVIKIIRDLGYHPVTDRVANEFFSDLHHIAIYRSLRPSLFALTSQKINGKLLKQGYTEVRICNTNQLRQKIMEG
jgi:hypothetical protein